MKNATIIINSLDAYSECWEPWIHGFKKYWKDCPWEVIFMTNNLEASYGKSSKVGTNNNWTYMMKKTLELVSTPYILSTLDDYWFTSKVNTTELIEFIDLMEKDNIAHIRLLPAKDGIESYPNDNRLKIIKKDSQYRTSLTSALWKTDIMHKSLKDGESPWQFEIDGSRREKGENLMLATKEWHFPIVRQDNPDPKWFGYRVLEQGRWQSGAERYAELEEMNIDTSVNPKEKI